MNTKTHAPSEKAFSYAIDLAGQLSALANFSAAQTTQLLLQLAGYDSAMLSKFIDVTQQTIFVAKKKAFVPVALAYVPPAGQYMVNGEHITLKVSKNHGGMLVFEKYAGYVGGLATAKCAAIAEALDSAEKAQAACIAYAKATGKCGVCNTKLTDPKSIAVGIGPVCAKKYS